MTVFEYRLCQRGLLLFVVGLALGFALPVFANRPAALGAHEAALQGGTFLIAMGLLWPRLKLTARWSALGANLLWGTFYALQTGLILGAMQAGGTAASPGALRVVTLALNVASSILMFALAIALLVAFRPSAQST